MLTSVMNLFFGCGHKNTGFPITPRSKGLRKKFETYIVCLDCGKEFPYSWDEMRVVEGATSAATALGEQARSFSITK